MDLFDILYRLGAMRRQRKSRTKTSMHVPSRFSANAPKHGSSFDFKWYCGKYLYSSLSVLVTVDYVISSIFT